jgi:ribA/ribD-fused uncharacterized protein
MTNLKVRETDTHVYFLNGPLSNWQPTSFKASLTKVGVVYDFNRVEQYMMASKAYLFGDVFCLQAIMCTDDPRNQKVLGRRAGGFSLEDWNDKAAPIWKKQARDIVFRGCWFRAQHDAEYRDYLIRTGSKILVEGNKDDPIWAVGLAWDDPAILDPANWNGTNHLGEVHMKVREYLDKPLSVGDWPDQMDWST